MQNPKEVVTSYLDAVWQEGNHAAIDEYVSPAFLQHAKGTIPGRDGLKAFFNMLNSGFSNLEYHVEDMIAEDDKVLWRWSLNATNTGAFMGMPATGKNVSLTGMSLVRVADGQIVEHWGEQDMLGLLQQLGIVPVPGQQRR
jgi:steroid delta-isomerase-like uncharacterized protein